MSACHTVTTTLAPGRTLLTPHLCPTNTATPLRLLQMWLPSTPGGWAMASAAEKPGTKVPGVWGRGSPHATQSSGSLCTLSSTCGIFENALGHLSWVA